MPTKEMKIRSVCLMLAGIAASAAFTPAAHAQTRYTLTEIGNPDASYTQVKGINNKGEIAGASDWRPFLWRNGQLIDLSSALGASASPESINELSQITGRYNRGSSGFLYTNGVVTDIGTVKHSFSSGPEDVNILGEVVFTALVFPPDEPLYYQWGHIYRNGSYEQVPTLGGTYSRAYAINDSGAVAGDATFTGDSQSHAIVYQNKELVDLGTLGGANSVAYDINQAGSVTGRAQTARSEDHAFISHATENGRRMIDLGVLPGGRHSYGNTINNLNQVVGASEVDAQTHAQVAIIYTDGKMWNLNKLIDPRDPSAGQVWLYSADGINDNGWIIARGNDSRVPDVTKAYLLRPLAQ